MFFAIATCQTCNLKKVGQFSEKLSQMGTWNRKKVRKQNDTVLGMNSIFSKRIIEFYEWFKKGEITAANWFYL